MPHRLRGSLERLTDDENRSLRPIGMSVREAAARTGVLLDRLADTPGVRLVAAGVLVAAGAPRIGFAVISASHLLLVESVAWPAGAYTVTPQGFVLCDGVYIGQSVHTLAGSVRTLRRVAGRRVVGAVVVVHPQARARRRCRSGRPGSARPTCPRRSPAGCCSATAEILIV
ncbi:hypothetical protein [Paractinoplanes durhamensis]|uniref:hypothetical protein n=1 Tax=Paractinoplanes durhamensis TaxID=113563 RepID=UPI0036453E9D